MSAPLKCRESLLEYFEGQKESMIRDVCELIRIPSVSGNPEEVARALGFLLERAAEMGFDVKTVLDGQAGVVEYGSGNETAGILVHVDVVPAAKRDEWHEDPFGGVLKNGEIWGRGAQDDKGPAIAALYAMKAVRDLGIPVRKKIQYIIGTQEESDWADLREYAKNYPVPDFGFTPDGEFPIGNVEYGTSDAVIKVPIGRDMPRKILVNAMSGELQAEDIPDNASAGITCSGRFILVAGEKVVTRHGDYGGTGNAIIDICRNLAGNIETRRFIPPLIELIADGRQDAFRQKIIDSLTFMEIKGDHLLVSFHVRFLKEDSAERIEAFFEEFAEEAYGEAIRLGTVPSVQVARDRPFMKILAEAYEALSGLEQGYIVAGGGTYAKAMPNIVSFGPLFPGGEDLCHLPDERISTDHLMKLGAIYGEALRKIISSSRSLK